MTYSDAKNTVGYFSLLRPGHRRSVTRNLCPKSQFSLATDVESVCELRSRLILTINGLIVWEPDQELIAYKLEERYFWGDTKSV